jgi:hypothetical protein
VIAEPAADEPAAALEQVKQSAREERFRRKLEISSPTQSLAPNSEFPTKLAA